MEKAWKAREQAEAAIGDVRNRRIEVDERLAQARNAAGDAAEDARRRVTAARDEFEQKADELSAKLDVNGEGGVRDAGDRSGSADGARRDVRRHADGHAGVAKRQLSWRPRRTQRPRRRRR